MVRDGKTPYLRVWISAVPIRRPGLERELAQEGTLCSSGALPMNCVLLVITDVLTCGVE